MPERTCTVKISGKWLIHAKFSKFTTMAKKTIMMKQHLVYACTDIRTS